MQAVNDSAEEKHYSYNIHNTLTSYSKVPSICVDSPWFIRKCHFSRNCVIISTQCRSECYCLPQNLYFDSLNILHCSPPSCSVRVIVANQGSQTMKSFWYCDVMHLIDKLPGSLLWLGHNICYCIGICKPMTYFVIMDWGDSSAVDWSIIDILILNYVKLLDVVPHFHIMMLSIVEGMNHF